MVSVGFSSKTKFLWFTDRMAGRAVRNTRNNPPPRFNDFLNWETIVELDENYRAEHEELINTIEVEEEDDSDDNPLFQAIKQRENGFNLCTNFGKNEILTIYHEMQPVIATMAGSRGPKPAISHLDSLILLLMMYKHGWEYVTLAFAVKRPKSTVKSAVERILPIVHQTLKKTWWLTRMRPEGMYDDEYPHIVLCVDTISVEVFRPRTDFNEAKSYFDGKNKIYALKKEVAVRSVPPHYALFSHPSCLGSEHDYSIFKKNSNKYHDYLLKTLDEREQYDIDENADRWAILGDKAYKGPLGDTPGIRKLFVRPNPTTVAEKTQNKKLSRVRCPVERFFGRMRQLFKILRLPFRLSHSVFDLHFDTMVLLTNEKLRTSALNEADYTRHRAEIQSRITKENEKRNKRNAAAKAYNAKLRLYLQEQNQ